MKSFRHADIYLFCGGCNRYARRMMSSETPLEQTQRHVTEGEERLSKQEALIKRLEQGSGHEMLPAAQDFLLEMHEWQNGACEHLEREKAKEPLH